MKRVAILIFLLLSFYDNVAQLDTTVVDRPKVSVQVDIMQIFNSQDPSLMISSELFLNARLSLIPEAGFLPTIRVYEMTEPIEVRRFLKFQQGLRFYIEDFNKDKYNIFLGTYFQYRRLTINDNYILGFECEDLASCVHYRNYTGNITTNRMRYGVESGGQFMIGDRAILGWSALFGRQYYTLDRANLFDGVLVERNRFLSEEAFENKLHIRVTFRVGFLIF